MEAPRHDCGPAAWAEALVCAVDSPQVRPEFCEAVVAGAVPASEIADTGSIAVTAGEIAGLAMAATADMVDTASVDTAWVGTVWVAMDWATASVTHTATADTDWALAWVTGSVAD